MPVRLNWFDAEETILLFEFEGRWTWEEFYITHAEFNRLLQARDYMVYTIIDLRNSGLYVPPNALTHTRNIADRQQPNAGITVFVSSNRFLQLLFKTGTTIHANFARYFRMVGTLDEAEALIAAEKAAEPTHE